MKERRGSKMCEIKLLPCLFCEPEDIYVSDAETGEPVCQSADYGEGSEEE